MMSDIEQLLLTPSALALSTAASGLSVLLAQRLKQSSWREVLIPIPRAYNHPFIDRRPDPTLLGVREGVVLGFVGFLALWGLGVGCARLLDAFGAGPVGRLVLVLIVYGVLFLTGIMPGIVGLTGVIFRRLHWLYLDTRWHRRRRSEDRERRYRDQRYATERKRANCHNVWSRNNESVASGIILVCDRCGFVDNSGYDGGY